MLVSQKKSNVKQTELEKLEQFDNNVILSKEQSNEFRIGFWNEYDKLSSVLLHEYTKQIEIFLNFQKSSTDVFFNYTGMWKNFYDCCLEQNSRLHEYYFLKNKSD